MERFLSDFSEKFLTYPRLMQFDEGGEFLNKDVKPLLRRHDIVYFSTVSKRKAAIVERLNRTIKTKILKIFEKNRNHIWISSLHDLIENYNDSFHRSIGMKPSEVNETNKFTVWGRLFGHIIDIEKPKFSVGDRVRVLHFSEKGQRSDFRKYFLKKEGKKPREHMLGARDKSFFSNEVFEVHEVLLGDPVVYKLYSPEAKVEILGKFYKEELSLVR